MKIALITCMCPQLFETFLQREINGLKKTVLKTKDLPLYVFNEVLFSIENASVGASLSNYKSF
tara:strand:- start:335 stop:523 length:189 start_codon:yes stop_codon:yes gene_type:complete